MIRTAIIGAALAASPLLAAGHQAPITGQQPAAAKPFKVEPIATFDEPWAMAFLPDGRVLVTEKAGRMLLVSADGKSRIVLTGVPKVNSKDQSALGEVVLHPDFATNRLVYFSYSAPGDPNAIVLARGTLVEREGAAALEQVTILYAPQPVKSGGHYAGRIAFSPDGFLFFSTGERQTFTPAQAKDATIGKVLRLTDDGKPAPGNPLAAEGFDPAIWSYGHRNPLGLAFDGQGRLWEAEMGPKGGDEINLILPGRNYGWPIVSNGDHYDGKPIPDHPTRPEFEAPKVSWNPSISPSSLLVYSGNALPQWHGKALVSALSGKSLILVELGADTAREAVRYDMGSRIRTVRQGPDGNVYLLEDGSNGRLLKLVPQP